MKIIVGLGNPGSKYQNNRHNVGARFARALKSSQINPIYQIVIPKVFMNDSGKAVREALRTKGLAFRARKARPFKDLYIVHDDLDIPLGKWKIQFGKGPKCHNGLTSIYQALGTDQFWHVRIGVDNRTPENRIPGEEYVLRDFTKEEGETIDKVIEKIKNQNLTKR